MKQNIILYRMTRERGLGVISVLFVAGFAALGEVVVLDDGKPSCSPFLWGDGRKKEYR